MSDDGKKNINVDFNRDDAIEEITATTDTEYREFNYTRETGRPDVRAVVLIKAKSSVEVEESGDIKSRQRADVLDLTARKSYLKTAHVIRKPDGTEVFEFTSKELPGVFRVIEPESGSVKFAAVRNEGGEVIDDTTLSRNGITDSNLSKANSLHIYDVSLLREIKSILVRELDAHRSAIADLPELKDIAEKLSTPPANTPQSNTASQYAALDSVRLSEENERTEPAKVVR